MLKSRTRLEFRRKQQIGEIRFVDRQRRQRDVDIPQDDRLAYIDAHRCLPAVSVRLEGGVD